MFFAALLGYESPTAFSMPLRSMNVSANHGVDSMKWLVAALIGSASGWLIASVTNEVAIAVISGGAIGFLATVALFGTRPVHSVAKVAGAMALGCLAGWLVAALTDTLAPAMAIGSGIGVLATIALSGERPLRSLVKVVVTMAIGFAIGWGIGAAVGDHRLGMVLAIPLGLPLLILLADTVRLPRHRPF
jgi:hypothetical protein